MAARIASALSRWFPSKAVAYDATRMERIPIVAPRVTTDRLVLRQFETRDFETFAARFMDPTAMGFLHPIPDRRTAWQKLAALNGGWTLTGAGWWAVEVRETGELAGTVGAFFRETVLERGPDADLELGWTVFPEHRRKRIAVESARAALAYGFERHPVKRVIAHVAPENVASAGVCTALGMTLEGDVDFYGLPSLRYAISRAR
jgi:RimJ/RimL family protein N-acetyltransferase